jgi:hypothetical protein
MASPASGGLPVHLNYLPLRFTSDVFVQFHLSDDKARVTICVMPLVFDDWKGERRCFGVFCEDAAIRWKAEQEKDLRKIRSENSEDTLTWQFFSSSAAGSDEERM